MRDHRWTFPVHGRSLCRAVPVKTYLLGLVLLLSCAAPPQHAPDWSSPAEGGRRTGDYWLNKLAAGEADRVLLDDAGIARLNAGYRALDDGPRDVTDDAVAARDVVNRQVISAFALIEGKVAKGELGLSKELLRQASERADRVLPVDEYRLDADELTLWCIPTLEPILKQPGGTIEFDRNRCSEVHVGEVVRILGRTSEGWSLVPPGRTLEPFPLLFTRRNVLAIALAHLGSAYGWANNPRRRRGQALPRGATGPPPLAKLQSGLGIEAFPGPGAD